MVIFLVFYIIFSISFLYQEVSGYEIPNNPFGEKYKVPPLEVCTIWAMCHSIVLRFLAAVLLIKGFFFSPCVLKHTAIIYWTICMDFVTLQDRLFTDGSLYIYYSECVQCCKCSFPTQNVRGDLIPLLACFIRPPCSLPG